MTFERAPEMRPDDVTRKDDGANLLSLPLSHEQSYASVTRLLCKFTVYTFFSKKKRHFFGQAFGVLKFWTVSRLERS